MQCSLHWLFSPFIHKKDKPKLQFVTIQSDKAHALKPLFLFRNSTKICYIPNTKWVTYAWMDVNAIAMGMRCSLAAHNLARRSFIFTAEILKTKKQSHASIYRTNIEASIAKTDRSRWAATTMRYTPALHTHYRLLGLGMR